MFKAIVFDIDGTAIPSRYDGRPSASVIQAVAKALPIVEVCAATGRTVSSSRPIFKALNLTAPCIISAGTQIIKPNTEEIIWQKPLTEDQVKQIVTILLKYNCDIYLGDSVSDKPIEKPHIIGPESAVFAMKVPLEDKQNIIDAINTVPEVIAHQASTWTPGFAAIHITHKEATKEKALNKLCEFLKLEKTQILSVGDSDNDLPLYASSGFKVAMGNATDLLKSKADYIAPSVNDDGLAHVIEKFILN